MLKCPNKNLPEWLELENIVPDMAYSIWNDNNGYGIDKAPNGEPSKLFSDLLSHYNGDRAATIQAKAKVFSLDFKTWFGDWLSDDKVDVSLSVDKNGEPSIFYHGGRTGLDTFLNPKDRLDKKLLNYGGTGDNIVGMYFTPDKSLAKLYSRILRKKERYIYPVYLNTKKQRYTNVWGLLGLRKKMNSDFLNPLLISSDDYSKLLYDGVDSVNWQNYEMVVFDSNQIKSIDNIGEFSKESNNIYYSKSDLTFYNGLLSEKDRLYSSFEADNLLSDDALSYLESREEYVDNGMQTYLSTLELRLSNELYDTLRTLYPDVELNFIEGLQSAPDAKGRYVLPTKTIDIILPLATLDTIPHEYAHHYIRMYINTLIVLDAIELFGSEEALVLAIGEQSVKQLGKAWEWWNNFVKWLKDKFDADTKIDKELLKNILTDAFLTNRNLDEVSYRKKLNDRLRIQSVFFSTDDKLSKTYESIKLGLESRLLSINRYTVKKLNTIDSINKILDELNKLEAKDGVIDFIDHVLDTIKDSKLFLSKKPNEISPRLLVLLKRDYLGFYTPMLLSINDILDTTDLLNDIPEFDKFKDNIKELLYTMSSLNNKYNMILEENTKLFIIKYAEEAGSPYVNDIVQWLNNPSSDISWLSYYLGQSSASSNEIIRIMENIIRNQKNEVERNTLSEGKKLITLLDKAKKVAGNDVMDLLLEKDKSGKRTGYFTRDLNYGTFYTDRTNEMDRLANKYNLTKDKNGKYIMPEDEVIFRRYNRELNKWYNKNAERRYTIEYYNLKNNLSLSTIEATDEINKRINLILNSVTRDKIIHDHELSDDLYTELLRLYTEKKNLSNFYNLDGSSKTGEDYDIALELKQFNETLNSNISYKTDFLKFEKVRSKLLKELTDEQYKKWMSRNLLKEYTDDFWSKLSELYRPQLSKEYDDLVEKRKLIHKLYRKNDSLEIDTTILNDDEIKMIKDLDVLIASLRSYEKIDSDQLKFNDIATIEKSDLYYETIRKMLAIGGNTFEEWYDANHYEDIRGKVHPISIWTYIQPVDAKHIRYIPNRKWSELDLDNSDWANKNFDTTSEEYIQPKRSLYDNTNAYNSISKVPEVKALYDSLLESMHTSTNKLGFLLYHNRYKLPLMSARTLLMASRDSNIFKGLSYMVKDTLLTKDDDKDYIPVFDRRPDNTLIKLIPTRYLNTLDNPNMISQDTVGSVIEFFNMADNYKQLSNVKDELEIILDRLSQLEYRNDNKFKPAGSTNFFKKAESLLDMHLYGKKKDRVEVGVFGKKINVSKLMNVAYSTASTINLAYNVWAMGTNAITGNVYTDIESLLGRYFDLSDNVFSTTQLTKALPEIVANIGNVNHNNKLMYMMLYNQVTRSNEETFANLDLSAVLRGINQHFWYNGYTAGDFCVKSKILGAIYHSYRLGTKADGTLAFMTKLEYIKENYINDPKLGEINFKQLNTTLWDAYDLVDNEWKVKPEYDKLVTLKLTDLIKNKINTIAAKVDGTLNDTDRSAIHANIYALFLVMHRNFMINGIEDRFKSTQFNYNTGLVEEGIYRSVGKLLINTASLDKMNFLHNLILNYHNMKDYELYAVRKVMLELGNAIALSLLVSTLLLPLADDDKDSWILLAITYVAMRSAFEFRTMYNPMELTALLNSPSAAFASFSNAAEMIKLLYIPNYFSDKGPFSDVSTGAYKGMPKVLRNFIKVTPFKNIIEMSNPQAKRKYLENQLSF